MRRQKRISCYLPSVCRSGDRVNREPSDFGNAFAEMTRSRPDAILMDILTMLNRERVMEFAVNNRLPAIYEFGFLVHDGGLMSYGPNLPGGSRGSRPSSRADSGLAAGTAPSLRVSPGCPVPGVERTDGSTRSPLGPMPTFIGQVNVRACYNGQA